MATITDPKYRRVLDIIERFIAERNSHPARARIVELEAELAEAKKDSARLDWMEEYGDRVVVVFRRWYEGKSSFRATIDDAREE